MTVPATTKDHMHLFRFSVMAATLGSLAVGMQLVACGGDDDSAPPTFDGGAPEIDGGQVGPTLTVSSARAKLYLGQTAKIDGASVAPNITTEFAWQVIASPHESTIKTLEGADTATPSFKPDLLGTYTLQVSGKKDGVTSSVVVLIEAIDAPVFWNEAVLTQSPATQTMSGSLSTLVGGVHGTRTRTIGCSVSVDDAGDEQAVSAMIFGARYGSHAGDTWEAPPGSPSRIALPRLVLKGANAPSFVTSLTVATSQSECGSPDAKDIETLETLDAGNGGGPPALTDIVHNARFSPDGNRIAYLLDVKGKARVATIGFDGSERRDLSAAQSAGPDGGLDPDAGTQLQSMGGPPIGAVTPRWKDSTHVGWMTVGGASESFTSTDWELYVVDDREGSKAELVMRCSDSEVRSFDFLPDGTIVAAARHLRPREEGEEGEQRTMNIVVFEADAATKACKIIRNLTGNKENGAVARDLALSPDKSLVAFFGGSGSGTANDPESRLVLSTVPVDGSRPAASVPGATVGADPGIGPRWAAGGTSLVWGQMNNTQGGNVGPVTAGRVLSIPASGGTPRSVVEGSMSQIREADGGQYVQMRFTYGIGQGCSATPGTMSSGIMLAGGAMAITALVARRKRRASK